MELPRHKTETEKERPKKKNSTAIINFIIIIYSCCYCYYYLNHRASTFIIFRNKNQFFSGIGLVGMKTHQIKCRSLLIRFNELLVAIPSAMVSDFLLCLRSRLASIHLNRQRSSRVLRCTFVVHRHFPKPFAFLFVHFLFIIIIEEYYSFGFDLFAFHRPSMNRLLVCGSLSCEHRLSYSRKNIKLPFLK